jgi:hypothetical protein
MRGTFALVAAAAAIAIAVSPGVASAAISAVEGEQFSGQLATVTVPCPAPTSPAATIIWGDGASSSEQVTVAGSQLTVSGAHAYLEEGSDSGTIAGTYLCSGDHQSFTASFTAQVADAPLGAHSNGRLVPANTGEGSTWGLGFFTDPGASGTLTTYGATIDWGDHTQSSGTVTPCTSSTFCVSTFDVGGSHTYYQPGTYTITVNVRDDGGATATITDTVNVLGQTVYCPSKPPSYWGDGGSDNYGLSAAQAVLDQNGNPTGQYTQTLDISPGYQITTNQCWIFAGVPQGGGNRALVHFATFGWVDLNGVYLTPQGNSELVVGSDGTVTAYKVVPLKPLALRGRLHPAGDATPTTYQVQAPTHDLPGEGPPLVTMGQVDLSANPWTYDPGSFHIGSFGPSPDGPHFGGTGITHGDIWLGFGSQPGTAGDAHLEADLPVPAFSTQPYGGQYHNAPAPTAVIAYDAYNEFAAGGGSSSGGGGGVGQQPPPTPCQQELIKNNCGGIPFQSRDAAAGPAPRRPARAGPAPRRPARAGTAPRRPVPAGPAPRRPVRAGARAARIGRAGTFASALASARAAGIRPAHAASGAAGLDPSSQGDWFLGGMGFGDASLTYDPATNLWTGGGSIPFFGATLSGQFTLHGDGTFDSGGASLACSTNPCAGVPLFPGVDLTSLGVSISSHPYRFSGNLGISVAGGLLTINGCTLAVFGSPFEPYTYDHNDWGCGPGSLQTSTEPPNGIKSFAAGVAADATLNVLGGIKLGSGYVFYISEPSAAYFEFAGHLGPIGLGPVSASAGIAGAFDTGNGQYNASGNIQGCADFPILGNGCIGLAGDVSNVGVGACAGGGGHTNGCGGPCAGFTYKWSGGFSFLASLTGSCDFGPIVVVVQRSGAGDPARAAQAGGPVSFTLPRGLPAADVYVDGSGGPPRFTVSGPGGEQLGDPTPGQPAKSSRLDVWPLPALDQTMIVIDHPAAGRWTLTPLPNSPAIVKVAYAGGVGPPSVHTRVSDPGGRFALHYKIRPRPGQSVEFVERGAGVFHPLGRPRGSSGTLLFNPALGLSRQREIVAIISLNGLPSRTSIVARYAAPAPPIPSKPSHLRIRATPRSLVITWGTSTNARGYLVTASLTDGRRLGYDLSAGARALTLPMVERGTGAHVAVTGLGPTGNPGPAATSRLAPAQAPARVSGISVRRAGKRVVITWRRAPRAVHYLLQIAISGPTKATLYAVTDKPTLTPENGSLMLQRAGVSTISVRGVSVEGQRGPAGSLRYSPGKRRARRGGGRGTALDVLFE